MQWKRFQSIWVIICPGRLTSLADLHITAEEQDVRKDEHQARNNEKFPDAMKVKECDSCGHAGQVDGSHQYEVEGEVGGVLVRPHAF